MTEYLLWFLIAFAAGSLPTGYIVGKAVRKVDVRTLGSFNTGATNVYRILGPFWGITTFVIDLLKGFIPTFAAPFYVRDIAPMAWFAVGIFAILGHIFSPFLGFRGGKGVATAAGVFFAIMPKPTLAAFLIFLAVLALTRYVSLGSILASLSLAVMAWITNEPFVLRVLTSALAVVIIIRHRANIKRLVAGNERKFGERIY
ncbi:MAG: glycerol-3-phosphate 1-O-acyltransferase PlsY [Endomicrobiales bacterium]|nr:glycerol-3-phosphate 1-O-acyltransferase PlsY [Endomicrobiales bacterium]